MTNPQRWIATVDPEGNLVGVEPYPGPDDSGPVARVTTYPTAYQYIATTKEEAEKGAMREWELADREPFLDYDDARAAEIAKRIARSDNENEVKAIREYEAAHDARQMVIAACDNWLQGAVAKKLGNEGARERGKEIDGELDSEE